MLCLSFVPMTSLFFFFFSPSPAVPDDLTPEEQQELENIRRRKQELLEDIQVPELTRSSKMKFCLETYYFGIWNMFHIILEMQHLKKKKNGSVALKMKQRPSFLSLFCIHDLDLISMKCPGFFPPLWLIDTESVGAASCFAIEHSLV